MKEFKRNCKFCGKPVVLSDKTGKYAAYNKNGKVHKHRFLKIREIIWKLMGFKN